MATNPFSLSAIQSEQQGVSESAAPVDSGSNPFSIQSIQGEARTQVNANLMGAVRANPDQSAEAARLSRNTGMPMDVIARNLQDVNAKLKIEELQGLVNASPTLNRAFRDKAFADMSHDDVRNLMQADEYIRSIKSGMPMTAPPEAPKPQPLTEQMGFMEASRQLRQQQDAAFATSVIGRLKMNGMDDQTANTQFERLNYTRQNLVSVGVPEGLANAWMAEQARAKQGEIKESTYRWDIRESMKDASTMTRAVVGAVRDIQNIGAGQKQFIGEVFNSPELAAAGAESRQRLAEERQAMGKRTGNDALAEDAIRNILVQAPGLVGSIMSGSRAVALTPMWTSVFGDEYANSREAGRDETDAMVRGALFATAEVVGEFVGLGDEIKAMRLAMRGSPINEIVSNLGKAIVKEIPGEQLTNVLQFSTDKFAPQGLTPNATFEDYLGSVADTLAATIAQSGIMAGTGIAIQHTARAFGKVTEPALEAQQQVAVLENLLKVSEASKVRARDSETLAGYINASAAESGTAPESVFIDGQTLLQVLQENNTTPEVFMQSMPGITEDIRDSAYMGAPVEIPLGEFTAKLAGSGLEQALIDHVRMAEDGLSRSEANEVLKQTDLMQQEAQRIMQEGEQADAVRTSAEIVKTNILGQLTQSNRFTADVNEAYANLVRDFYTATATRLKITPEQMYERYPLTVRADGTTGAAQYDQAGQLRTSTPEFTSWFKSSTIVNADGTPKRMYHGTAQNISAFKAKQAGAIFVTENPTFAEDFSEMSKEWMVENYNEILTREQYQAALATAEAQVREEFKDDPEKADLLVHKMRMDEVLNPKVRSIFNKAIADQMPSGPNIMPLYVSAQNPFDYDNPEHVAAVVAQLNKETNQWGQPRGDKSKPYLASGNWEEIEKPTTQAAIKAAGFDGFYVKEARQKNLAVYDSNQIKSVFNKAPTMGPDVMNQGYAQQVQNLEQTITDAGGEVQDTMQIDQLVDSKDVPVITLQDMLGFDIFPTIADRTAAAALYTGIDASGIDVAIPLLGGPLFPLRESNVAAGIVWANRGKGVIAQKAAKLKAGANYMMVVMGDADMHQSNSTVAAAFMSTLEAWARDGRVSPENVDALGNLVRITGEKMAGGGAKAAKVKEYLANFPGFDDSEIMHAYMDGISFDARKRVLEIMTSKQALDLGAPPMARILDATREPSLAGHRWGDGVLLVEVDQQSPQVELGTEGTTAHPDFPVGVRGKVVGKLDAAINWQLLWQDWLAENADKDSPRRAFELSKPIVTVTQDLIDRIGPIKQENVESARQARLAADFAADSWSTSDDAVKEGGVSPQEFLDAIDNSAAKVALSEYKLTDVKAAIKDKSMKIYQLGADGQIFFALKKGDPGYAADYGIETPGITDNEVLLTSVINNEPGARGIGGPAVVLKALQEGATVLDAFAVKNTKYPNGFLPSLYAAFGFEKVAEVPFDPQYYSDQKLADAVKFWQDSTPGYNAQTDGYPPLVIMKWKGTDADRQNIINKYLRSGLAGLLEGGASADVRAFAAEFGGTAGAQTGEPTGADVGGAAGDQGAGAGAPVASRARGTVQGIANLTDNELTNLGLTTADRDAVQRALGVYTGGDVLNQGQVDPASDNFKQWFGESKVVDASGKPMVVYHSGAFDATEIVSQAEMHKRNGATRPIGNEGIYFSADPAYSAQYARNREGAVTYPVYLSLQNPLIIGDQKQLTKLQKLKQVILGKKAIPRNESSASPRLDSMYITPEYKAALIAQGYDGIINEPYNEIVAFNPNQIKSAVSNSGAFGPTNNILEQQARGTFSPSQLRIDLLKDADLSTFLHETGHFFLEVLADLASQQGAPADVQTDMAAVLKWFGVPDVATWMGYSLEQKRKYHEKFAESFEQYLFEGKAPSEELRPMFQRFREFMTGVYKSLQNFLAKYDNKLSDEVRAVFDRLIATDEQIKNAETTAGFTPVFTSKPDFMTDEEWAAYEEQASQGTQTAIEKLQSRSVRDLKWTINARSRILRQLQRDVEDKRKAMREEVTTDVRQQPVYAVQRFLKFGELMTNGVVEKVEGGKLSLPVLKEIYGEGPAAPWRYIATNMVTADAETGLHPSMLSELFGFKDSDIMVRAIIGAESEAAAIDGLTDQRLLETYGDLVTEKGVERAANEAVHNEARARFVATELRALQDAMNVRGETGKTITTTRVNKDGTTTKVQYRQTTNVMLAAAKEFATNLINRRKIMDLKPGKHTAAEARAAKRAEKLMGEGDTPGAIAAKRDQLLNHYAARMTIEAQKELERKLDYLKKFDKDSIRKKLPPEYLAQIDAILERFDLRTGVSIKALERRASLADWVKNQQEMGLNPAVPEELLEEAMRKSYKQMTVEEFRGVVDTVRNIEHLGRLKDKLLTLQDQRAFSAVVGDVVTSIEDNATESREVRVNAATWQDDAKDAVRAFFSMHRKFASLARQLDGFKDAGAVWTAFIRGMNAAGDAKAVMNEQATKALSEIFKPLYGQKMGQKVYIPAIDSSLTLETRLAIALNWGNEANRQRIMDGDMWSASQVDAILKTLTREQLEFVNKVWEHIDSYWPQISAKEERVSGLAPEKVAASAFEVVLDSGETVQMRGGYYPLKYDPDRSGRAEADSAAELTKQMMMGQYTRATTRRGHTKSRAETVNRAVRKDIGVIFQHIEQVTHDLAYHEWLIDSTRLLRNTQIDTAIRTTLGPEVVREMRKAIEDIAAGDVPAQNQFERGMNHLRQGVTVIGMGWNLMTSLMQPLGLTQSMVRIGPKWVGKGLSTWMGDAVKFENTAKMVYEKSDFMRLRGETQNREINEIRNKVKGAKFTAIEESYFYLIQKAQLVADLPTWLGQYEKSIYEGADDATAVAMADQSVRDAQGGGQVSDLAQVQRGGPLLKLFTNFYSYFNTTYNLTVERYKATSFKDPLQVGRFAVDMLMLHTVPVVLSYSLKAALKGGGDDEDLMAALAKEQLNYLMGTMVGLREIGGAISGYSGYQGPAGTRFFSEVGKLAKQTEQGEVDAALLKSLNNVAGILLHYPAGQVTRTTEGFLAIMEGETANPMALVLGPPKQ